MLVDVIELGWRRSLAIADLGSWISWSYSHLFVVSPANSGYRPIVIDLRAAATEGNR